MDLVVEDGVNLEVRLSSGLGSWWSLAFNRNTVESTSSAIHWYSQSDNLSITENTITNGGFYLSRMYYEKGTYNISRNTLHGDNAYIYFQGYTGRNDNNQGSWVKVDDNIIKNVSSSDYDPIYVERVYGDVSISNNVLDNLVTGIMQLDFIIVTIIQIPSKSTTIRFQAKDPAYTFSIQKAWIT